MKSISMPLAARCLVAAAILMLAGCGDDPQRLLDDMGRAYRSADGYSDKARVTVRRSQGDAATETTQPFSVAFSRPDRIRIEAYDARLVANGSTLFAAVSTVPGQVLQEPVQSPLALDQLVADEAVRAKLSEGEAGCPTQLPLLLADDTVSLILDDAQGPPRIVGMDTVDGHRCSHVEIAKPDGTLGLWIDRESKLLRKMRVPTAAYATELSRQAGAPVALAVEVEFTAASFDANLPAEAFAFEVPVAAETVARLQPLDPPQPMHPRVGTKADLSPLETIDHLPLGRESIGDVTLVLDFFFEGCGPSSRSLPQVAKGISDFTGDYARRHGGERPPLKHVAVSLDPEEVPATAVRQKLAEFGGVGLLARDPQGVMPQALGLESFPATVIVARDGMIADVIIGDHARIAADVSETLSALDRGVGTTRIVGSRHERRILDHGRAVDRAAGSLTRLPEQVIAPRRQPARFRLDRVWRAAGVALPGNVVCLDAAEGLDEPRIVAIDGWRTVVELDASGAERARRELDLPTDSAIGFLRTAPASDGRRWWLAGRRGGQQVFIFDDSWRLRGAYPDTGAGDPAGIGDAELADVDGDGTPEIIAGCLGTAGVCVASLDGSTRWRDRTVAPAIDVAIGLPRAAGVGREVLAVSGDGRVARVVREPGEAGGVARHDGPLVALAAGPVAADAAWALVGIAAAKLGSQAAVGIDPATLAPAWSVPLGDGVHRDGPIDPIAWADLLGTPRRQWLIAAPDGSVTVAWADGRVVDRYQHGRPLVGIGGFRHGGRGHVVLATREGLEAFAVTDVALD